MTDAKEFPPPEAALFADPAALIARAWRQFRVPERIGVPEVATRYIRLENPGGGYTGPFDFALAPYLRRPMECLSPGSPYRRVFVEGASQCGKSTIGVAWWAHTILADPADMLCACSDKQNAHDYSVQTIAKMLRINPALRDKQMESRGADNIFLKQFTGCMVFFAWPVASQFRQRPIPRIQLDDFDAMPEDVDGEGDPLGLAESRQATFAAAKTYVNSSPSLGDTRGIARLRAQGSDEQWHVRCRHCGEFFALRLDACLVYEKTLDADDAARTACVACPHCGGAHEQADKPALMESGVWAGPLQKVSRDGTVTGPARGGAVASFHFDGLMGFVAWADLARELRQAELTLDLAQDEKPLKTFFNTKAGINYRSRLDGALPVAADELMQRAAQSHYRLREVPEWVRCLTGAADVQGNRFECIVRGWGPGFESAIVDRYALVAVPETGEALQPGRRSEHWRVLMNGLFWRRYPVAGRPELSLPILNAAIDTGGLDGVTDHAFEFWHAAVRWGVPPSSITLIKGGNKPNARRLPPPTIDTKRQVKGQPEAGLYVPNVSDFKDTLSLQLKRLVPGPGHVHLPRDFERRWADELTAEEKIEGAWVRKPHAANETLDLMVYADVAQTRHGAQDSSFAWVAERAAWALPAAKPATHRPEAVVVVLNHHAPPAEPAAKALREAPRRRIFARSVL